MTTVQGFISGLVISLIILFIILSVFFIDYQLLVKENEFLKKEKIKYDSLISCENINTSLLQKEIIKKEVEEELCTKIKNLTTK